MTEDRGQMTEDRGQMTEDPGAPGLHCAQQRSEVRCQKSEGWGTSIVMPGFRK